MFEENTPPLLLLSSCLEGSN